MKIYLHLIGVRSRAHYVAALNRMHKHRSTMPDFQRERKCYKSNIASVCILFILKFFTKQQLTDGFCVIGVLDQWIQRPINGMLRRFTLLEWKPLFSFLRIFTIFIGGACNWIRSKFPLLADGAIDQKRLIVLWHISNKSIFSDFDRVIWLSN